MQAPKYDVQFLRSEALCSSSSSSRTRQIKECKIIYRYYQANNVNKHIGNSHFFLLVGFETQNIQPQSIAIEMFLLQP